MTDNSDITDSISLFANAFTYLGRPLTRQYGQADVYTVGIPFDLATTGRAGTRHGPGAIRQASTNLRWEECRWPWQFPIFERLSVADYGDLEFSPGSPESMMDEVVSHVGALVKAGHTVLSFGGDHFVTLPLLRAHHQHYGTLSMIHFDAHTDTYSNPDGHYDHGCMFYHAPREGLIDASRSVQIGIRTEYTLEDHQFTVIDAATANDMTAAAIIEQVKSVVGDNPVYVTLDIDCLDPAFAPGTGTPVVGGLTSDRVLKLIRALTDINVIGMDVVEVAPAYDHADVTALAAATIGLEMLYALAARK